MINTVVFFIKDTSSIQTMKTVLETLAAAFPDVPSILQADVVNVPGKENPMVTLPLPSDRIETIMSRLDLEMENQGLHKVRPA